MEDIFATFHDGAMTGWTGDFKKLTLKISCDFLAKLFNEKFNFFYLDLIELQNLELIIYDTQISTEKNKGSKSIFDLNKIFSSDIEICYAKSLENKIQIDCWQENYFENYIANKLLLSCQNIKIYDQNKVQISEDRFFNICDSYWRKHS